MQKYLYIVLAFTLIFTFALKLPLAEAETFITDSNLEKAIKNQLGISETKGLTIENVSAMGSLAAQGNHISNLKGLEYASRLTELNISDNEVTDLSYLKNISSLETVIADGNELESVAALTNLNKLKWVTLGDNRIADLTAFRNLSSLETLSLYNNKISNINSLQGLTTLKYLDLEGNKINDLSALSNLNELTTLLVSGNELTSLDSLDGLEKLSYIYASNNQIADLSPLSSLSLEKGEVNLSSNKITDLGPLRHMEVSNSLQLDVSNNQVISLEPLKGLTGLTGLNASNNQINTVEHLSNLQNLTSLDLSNNQLKNLSGLNLKSNTLYTLDFTGNELADIRALTPISAGSLDLSDNKISDIRALKNLTSGYVNLKGNPLSRESMKIVDILRQKGVEVEFEGSTERFGGANRYDTAAEIVRRGWETAETVFIAPGSDFPDALAGAPLAYRMDAPILLTTKETLPRPIMQVISELTPRKAVILGGVGVISREVENQLKALGISEVERLGGKNRYGTAKLIFEKLKALNGSPKTAVIAYGRDFPDALSVASVAAQNGYPILLTEKAVIPTETLSSLSSIQETIVVGGEGVISKSVFSKLPNAKRISGPNRFATALKISQQLGQPNKIFYIANGRGFADALAGSVVAAKEQAQLLLVEKTKIDPEVSQLLKDQPSSDLVILGGEGVVAKSVAEQLQ
ncbi:cell wall-binding repeat-containing protein [Bacillus sp. ISL-37]|uniref:cell wall-binding repeat-containing protein n=1 Tax=Bacillus sp. ISL-37 TaxID=2819123 RepID=UPI001BEC2FAB|nr:cell wall-binding repeat-containing protein [Bacillus sp. ISL-37]MBT2686007.1 cell wall-binding repeat-containing protein [Bacillus sp. ISL-37]